MTQFLLHLVINGAAVAAAALLIPGINLSRDPILILVVALIFGLVNAVIRPLVLLLTCLLNLLTLGLFTLVVNAIMFALTANLTNPITAALGRPDLQFTVDGPIPAFLGALVASIVSFVLTRALGVDR